MSMGSLAAVAGITGGKLHGVDQQFASVSTDTRTLSAGQLFFALQGANHDGSRYLDEARQRGAVGAVVPQYQPLDWPQVEVRDTRVALADWAAHWRSRFTLPVIAVTGSNGKTTVKEMIAAILRIAFAASAESAAVLATRGNLNNEIGVPLTILELRKSHRAAVFELGANHVGEIALLTRIAAPAIGVVTNAGIAHLEGFGSAERVARGKGELFSGLPADGTAVINRDDRYFPLWLELAGSRKQLSFGLAAEADCRAVDIRTAEQDLAFRLLSPAGELDCRLPMAGHHNVINALAAAAATLALGVTPAQVRTGLAGMANVAGRLRVLGGPRGSLVYDDSYNANPGSMAAAIDYLASLPGERWLVLGDMGELGPDSLQLHRELGARARAAGIERLCCLGPMSQAAAESFGGDACWYATLPELLSALDHGLPAGARVLVKASRAMGLERVVQHLARGAGDEGGQN